MKTKEQASNFRKDLELAIASLEQKHNVKLTIGTIRFNEETITTRLEGKFQTEAANKVKSDFLSEVCKAWDIDQKYANEETIIIDDQKEKYNGTYKIVDYKRGTGRREAKFTIEDINTGKRINTTVNLFKKYTIYNIFKL